MSRNRKDRSSSRGNAVTREEPAIGDPWTRRTLAILLVGFLSFLIGLEYFKTWEPDAWLHLSVGRFIVQHGSLPVGNLFSFTETSHSWIGHEWLFGVISFELFTGFGPIGLFVLRSSLFLATIGVLYRCVRASGWEVLNVGGLAIAAQIISIRFNDRPEMFSALFTAGYFWVLEEWKRRGGRRILVLLPAQILWANLHGYFLLGPILILLFVLGEFAASRRREAKILSLIGLAALTVSLLTPQFVGGFVATVKSAFVLSGGAISEFAPTFMNFKDFWNAGWFETEKCLVWVPLVSLLLNRRRTEVGYWFIWAAFLWMFMRSQRNILYYTLVSVPITLFNVRQVVESGAWSIRSDLARRMRIIAALAMSGILLYGTYDCISGRRYKRNGLFIEPGIGVSALFIPSAACAYIEQTGLDGPIFNNYLIGSYLLWRFADRSVFIDGRGFEAYSRGFMSYYFDVAANRVPVSNLLKRYPVRYFMLSPFMDSSVLPLISALSRDPAWRPVYIDHTSVIFAPSSLKLPQTIFAPESNPAINTRWGLTWAHYNMGALLMQLGMFERGMREIQAAYVLEPNFQPLR